MPLPRPLPTATLCSSKCISRAESVCGGKHDRPFGGRVLNLPGDLEGLKECPFEDESGMRCQKGGKTPSAVKRHALTHLGEDFWPWGCEFEGCTTRFQQRSGCITHENKHRGAKPHVCAGVGCGKGFADQSAKNRHQRTCSMARARSASTNSGSSGSDATSGPATASATPSPPVHAAEPFPAGPPPPLPFVPATNTATLPLLSLAPQTLPAAGYLQVSFAGQYPPASASASASFPPLQAAENLPASFISSPPPVLGEVARTANEPVEGNLDWNSADNAEDDAAFSARVEAQLWEFVYLD